MPKSGYWNIWLGIGCESWLVENGWKRGPTSWLRSAELLGHRCLKVILQFCLFAPTSRYFSYTFIVTTLSDGLKYVTDLFKGRPSRHEGERGMCGSKWFATSQRLRVIAAMVKGKAWRKVISTENLFGKMVAGLGLPFQILILASLVTIVLPTTPRHKIGGLCGDWQDGSWNNFHREILCEFEYQLGIKGSLSLQRPWSTAWPNQRK